MSVARLFLSVLIALALVDAIYAADSAVELSQLLPAESNTVSVLRVARILESPRAISEDWANTAEQDFLNGASHIPPWVDTLVIGSLVRPELRQEVWSTGVLKLPRSVTMGRIALREETRVQTLSGVRAVRGRRNALLVEIEPRLLGVRVPAIRQEAARWARAAANRETGPLSDYLQKTVANPAHIVLGIDLQDVPDTQNVRSFLEESALMPEDPIAKNKLLQLLNTLRGVTFSATIGHATSAQVKMDFGGDISGLAPHVAAVFRTLIDDLQMSLDEFNDAKLTAPGNTVTLSMHLSDESLRRVVSLVTMPSPPLRANDETIASAPAPADAPPRVEYELAASQRYYRSVSQTIDDLFRASRRSKDYSRTATWHDNFARKIDQLTLSGVDAELLKWGRRVSEQFRALAASLRGQSVQVAAEQKTLVYDIDYNAGWVGASWWGGVAYGEPSVDINSNLQQVRERQAAAVVAGAKQRIAIWQMINSERIEIENRMKEKHGDGFIERRRR